MSEQLRLPRKWFTGAISTSPGHGNLVPVWRKSRDVFGRVYYWNIATRASQWTNPDDEWRDSVYETHLRNARYKHVVLELMELQKSRRH